LQWRSRCERCALLRLLFWALWGCGRLTRRERCHGLHPRFVHPQSWSGRDAGAFCCHPWSGWGRRFHPAEEEDEESHIPICEARSLSSPNPVSSSPERRILSLAESQLWTLRCSLQLRRLSSLLLLFDRAPQCGERLLSSRSRLPAIWGLGSLG
jgi:hypothetical protein